MQRFREKLSIWREAAVAVFSSFENQMLLCVLTVLLLKLSGISEMLETWFAEPEVKMVGLEDRAFAFPEDDDP